MENIIQDLRMDYTDITITGLFLVYPAYYVHILEVAKILLSSYCVIL